MNPPPQRQTHDRSDQPLRLNDLGVPETYPFRDDWEVTPRQVKAMLDAGQDFLLIDCRTPREYGIARIFQAQLLPLQELGDRFHELHGHAHRKIVIHCHHGGRSLQMTAMLRQQGYSDVKSMAGGIDLWAVDVDPAIARY